METVHITLDGNILVRNTMSFKLKKWGANKSQPPPGEGMMQGGSSVTVKDTENPRRPAIPLSRSIDNINWKIKWCKSSCWRGTCTAFIDAGAQVPMIAQGFCQQYGLKIKSLDNFLQLEGIGGLAVTYLQYVKVNLGIPQLSRFNEEILMFVINNRRYGKNLLFKKGLG